jgi:hypothetical protein
MRTELAKIQRATQSAVGFPVLSGEPGVVDDTWPVGDLRRYATTLDGTVDNTAAVNNCKAAALLSTAEMIVTGTPLIGSGGSGIVFDKPLRLRFLGGIGQLTPPFRQLPKSYFIKSAACVGPAVLVSAAGFVAHGGGVLGQLGNTGDNIQLTGWGPRWHDGFSGSAGQDGWRLGQNTTGGTANRFNLYSPVSINNGRHGIFLDDFDDNMNAGNIFGPDCSYNTGDGINCDRGGANAFVAILTEGNTGWGVHLMGRANTLQFLGGDSEANTAGDVKLESTTPTWPGMNAFYGLAATNVTDLATNTTLIGVPYAAAVADFGPDFRARKKFGCNGAAPQGAVASGGALAAYGAGANGFDTAGNASALYAEVVAIRAALVANGIMS